MGKRHLHAFKIMLNKRSLSIEPFYHWWQDRVFIAATILAVLLHIFVLLIHFAMPSPSEQSTKEIAISIRSSNEPVQQADFLAQADQQGSGAFREAHRTSSDTPNPTSNDASTGDAQLETLQKVQQQRELKFEEKVLMTVLSWQKQADASQREKRIRTITKPISGKSCDGCKSRSTIFTT